MLAAVQQDGFKLGAASTELRADKDVVLAAVKLEGRFNLQALSCVRTRMSCWLL